MKFILKITNYPVITVFLVLAFLLLLSNLFMPMAEQQFSLLADSFLHGKIYFTSNPGRLDDLALYDNHYFWPLGPAPAILLTPFVAMFKLFGQFFYQGYLQFFLVIGVFYLCIKIARTLDYDLKDSLFLAVAFTFASAFIGVSLIHFSWYFSQVVVTFFLLLSVYEFLTKKRYLLIGSYYALILATRVTASLSIIFFILYVVISKLGKRDRKFRDLMYLVVPGTVTLFLLFLYNYSRFANIFEFGYTYQVIYGVIQKAREYGILSIIHIPGNLYYLLLATPLPIFKDNLSHVLTFPFIKIDSWGMSIFVTSPYFIYLVFLKYKDTISRLLWVTIALTAIPTLLYYGVGYIQFGYRYSLDFLPFLFFLLVKNYKEGFGNLSKTFNFLIMLSALFNMYLFLTVNAT